MANFRESYPIDFDLYDKDTQNVLYIEDTSDQLLTLEIRNASAETIQLSDLTLIGGVSNSNYHFKLRFRPGTLSAVTLGGAPNGMQLAAESALNWEMAPPEQDISGMDVIYLKSIATSLSMAPDESQSIVFENVGADAGQGARGTRVELWYHNMVYSSAPTLEVSSYREIHMSVVNHRGKQNFPLHVGFVGDNGVLNDGATPNDLTLRFSNTLVYDAATPDLSQLTFLYDADATLRSRIVLSFDTGTVAAEEWALGDSNDINGITITQPNGWAITKDTSGESPEWILYPATQDQVLYGIDAPSGNEYFDLDIGTIITGFPTGHTHLHIRYENIPGYWDGQLKVTLEKRPLVYNGDNVGIGTSGPAEKLDVNGNARITGELHIDSASNAVMHYGNRGKLGQATAFNPDNNQNGLWIEASNNGSECGGIFMNGNTLSIWSPGDNDLLRVYDEDTITGDPRFVINNSGNVGIGTTSPNETLEVFPDEDKSAKIGQAFIGYMGYDDYAGFSHIDKAGVGNYALLQSKNGDTFLNASSGRNIYFRENNSNKMVLDEGKLGIGTTSPSEKLHIKGTGATNAVLFLEPGEWNSAGDYATLRFGDNNHYIRGEHTTGMTIHDVNGVKFTGGYVGIGHTAPGSRLDVRDTGPAPTVWVQGINVNAINARNNSNSYPTVYAGNNGSGGHYGSGSADYAEYFESTHGNEIPVGTSVVLEGEKIRAAKKGETPIGIISSCPMIIGNLPDEWPKKYLKDKFGRILTEDVKKEKLAPKRITVTKERQKTEKKTIEEEVTRIEVLKDPDGKYVRQEITEKVTKEIEESVFQEVDLYDADGNLLGKHPMPVLESYEEEKEILDEDGNPVMIPTGEFETVEEPRLNPEYDPEKTYIQRGERPEWNCVGLLGQLPLIKGQSVAASWIKMKKLEDNVELWLIK